MKVEVNGFEYDTNQVTITFDNGTSVKIQPEWVTITDESKEWDSIPTEKVFGLE